jgi:hypothetical protein
MGLIVWIFIILIIWFIIAITGAMRISNFLSKTKSIKTNRDLQDFKKMARKSMYQSLAFIGVAIIGLFLYFFGLITGKFNFYEIMLVVFFMVIVLIINQLYIKKTEKQAMSLKVEDERFKKEYETVCKSWVKKPFPDF